MNITIVGLGYVGLANLLLLAKNNHIVAVDINTEKVDMLNMRKSPIKDEEIEKELLNDNLDLFATTNFESAIKDSDIVVIATPTNYDVEKKYFDVSSVEQTVCKIMKYDSNMTVIIKSTVPIGYTESLCEKYGNDNILFAPEFLREGKALYDNLYPFRIIVGYSQKNENRRELAYRIADLFVEAANKKDISILIMHSTEAEAVKLFSNTYLALRVAFFNELDILAEERGLSTKNIIDGICLDERIGSSHNNPSFGYGGYCLPKDSKQLLASYVGVPNNIIAACVDSNVTRMDYIAKRIVYKVSVEKGKVVGIYRLIMKLNSDNFRESAILGIIQRIKDKGLHIVVYEPLASELNIGDSRLIESLDEFKRISDIIVANRYEKELEDVKEKVYTRDIYNKD